MKENNEKKYEKVFEKRDLTERAFRPKYTISKKLAMSDENEIADIIYEAFMIKTQEISNRADFDWEEEKAQIEVFISGLTNNLRKRV